MSKHTHSKAKYYLLLLVILLVLCLGVGAGFYFFQQPVVVTDAAPTDVPQATTTPEPSPAKLAEEAALESLKNEFISIMKQKYPTVDLCFAIKNLDTGAQVIYDNKQMNSASIIKLFIMETVYSKMAEGTYTLTEERKKDLDIMITESDNEASNRFIDDFGGQNEQRKVPETNGINQFIQSRGYQHTELNRKMHDKTPPEGPSGYQNYTCVSDVLTVLEGIYNKTLLEEPYNTQAINLLKNQKRRGKIPAKIAKQYPDVIVANKTGELSQVENDAALIIGEDFNLAFVVLTDKIPFKANGNTDYDLKEKVQMTISELGLKLVDFYKQGNFAKEA